MIPLVRGEGEEEVKKKSGATMSILLLNHKLIGFVLCTSITSSGNIFLHL